MIAVAAIITLLLISCATKRSVRVSRERVPQGASVAVIFDGPNNIKNVVLSRFMNKGFRVKAFNASDLYGMSDVFDIKDMKRVSNVLPLKEGDQTLTSLNRAYDNIYKLHIYNFELSKAETLTEVRRKWNVNYLVLLDLKDWQDTSWGRAVNLENFELIWVENYPSQYKDDPATVVDHFISSMSGS